MARKRHNFGNKIMPFISVAAAEDIILNHARDYGIEYVPFIDAEGRVLAENILADRDFPPYDRVTMDGIAIKYAAFANGTKEFRIKATMAAGDAPVEIVDTDECVELMTGCALPTSTDTVVRYEDVIISDGIATIQADTIKNGSNIHSRGSDKKQGEIVVPSNTAIDATVINMAASVGAEKLAVWKMPRVVIISTGDELVDTHEMPTPYQVRRSNGYVIQAILRQHCIEADTLHINDELVAAKEKIGQCLLQYDVIILSGGVSMGKYDFVPGALAALGVEKLFHKVQQRPGKPFWFGAHNNSNTLVFAFPGNPVSAFLCLHRYFIPWLQASVKQSGASQQAAPIRAQLSRDVTFMPALQYFLQVSISISVDGQLVATPVAGNGSGDFTNLLVANAFMELPAEISNFKAGEVYRVWPFKQIV